MRKSHLALMLVGSLMLAVTTVLAGNPAADSIPDVGSIDVPAGSGQAGDVTATNADTDVAVETGAPALAAAEGLATAEDSGDPLAVAPASAADGGLATADLAKTGGELISGSPPAADGLATAEAAGLTTLTGVESILVPAADEAGNNPPAAVPTGAAADGLFVAEVPGSP